MTSTPEQLDGIRMVLNTVLACQFDVFEARPLHGWNTVIVRTVMVINGEPIIEFVNKPDTNEGIRAAQQELAARWKRHLGR